MSGATDPVGETELLVYQSDVVEWIQVVELNEVDEVLDIYLCVSWHRDVVDAEVEDCLHNEEESPHIFKWTFAVDFEYNHDQQNGEDEVLGLSGGVFEKCNINIVRDLSWQSFVQCLEAWLE